MTTREVAGYLRIKERKVYDLLRGKRIPSTRVTGKWLFPKHLIDQWVADGTEFPDRAMPPPVLAGSHDPLLEWSLNESGCGLALMPGGSLDGLERLAAGEAVICGLHVFDPESGGYNRAAVERTFKGLDVVLIEWAWRDQGLVLAAGNPLAITSIEDLRANKARVVARHAEAGSRLLFDHLLAEAGMKASDLEILEKPARGETDLALRVSEGKADAGLAVASAAHAFKLDFLSLHRERFDLLVRRRDYFEDPVQKLLAFARTDAFEARAADMAGYETSALGKVVYNGP